MISETDTAGWLRTLVTGRPHQVVRNERRPYLYRRYLFPHNRFGNPYLHRFVQSNGDEALHRHPWPFVTVVLAGRNREITEFGVLERRPARIARWAAVHRHRVEMLPRSGGSERLCWTEVLARGNERARAFRRRRGSADSQLVPWRDFCGGGRDEVDAARRAATPTCD